MTAAIFGLIGTILGVLIATGYQWFWSVRERQDKFRLAALEKRLEVHQEAYTLWLELLWSVSKSDERIEVISKGQDWWNKNCLYLDSKSMEAFRKALIVATHFELRETSKERGLAFEKIQEAGKYIAEGVNLPFLDTDIGKIKEEKTS